MHILTELSLIFALCLAGEGIAALLPVAFPASVISMLLLMALLLTGVVKERRIQTVSRFLVTNICLLYTSRGYLEGPAAYSYHLLVHDNTSMGGQSWAEARRVTWQLTFTATGRPATWVGAVSMDRPKQVVRPPKPWGPMPRALISSSSSSSSWA